MPQAEDRISGNRPILAIPHWLGIMSPMIVKVPSLRVPALFIRAGTFAVMLIFVSALPASVAFESRAWAISLIEIAELLAHPDQYDHQDVVVTGKVTNVQLATNRQGQPAYGFLLQDQVGT